MVGEGVVVGVWEGVEDGMEVGVCVEVGVWEAVGVRVGAVVGKGDMVGDATTVASGPAMAGGSPQAARRVLSPASRRKVRRDSASRLEDWVIDQARALSTLSTEGRRATAINLSLSPANSSRSREP